ncbi:hypothetical protein GQ55_1G404500 [Panicum hallii var. hallii]|uniref:Protein kinase domain-containing protein n=1 Tax=Panicum hallii var. hallii TaxID=1504633 RepID=A0A2T7FCM6_9POAL|nr:hypothetical protein GQ55_1G404500 [Panicum hallii var. hallii]
MPAIQLSKSTSKRGCQSLLPRRDNKTCTPGNEPPRLTRRNATRESAYVPRPAGLTRFSPPPDQTVAVDSSRADDSESEEGDESGAKEEEVGEVEETGAGTAAVTEASASSVVAVVKRRITNWTKLELVGAGSFGRVYKAGSEEVLSLSYGLPVKCLMQCFVVPCCLAACSRFLPRWYFGRM